mgnify:CR=1 FL=1
MADKVQPYTDAKVNNADNTKNVDLKDVCSMQDLTDIGT